MLSYLLIRFLGECIAQLPRSWVLALGKVSGFLLYHLHTEFRKKTLTNLTIVFGKQSPINDLKRLAKGSFYNLATASLEFISFKGNYEQLAKRVRFEGEERVRPLLEAKKGVIFLTAHQANWEIPFLAVTQLFPGIGIGKPIKNRRLYRWVLSVREMHSGKIILPKNALKEGTKALREGKFVGIVGDQAYPSSPYSYPFLGTTAWTSTAPALLAYRTGAPIVFASTRREGKGFVITVSAPIFPDTTQPIKEEIPRLMDESMKIMEKSVANRPSEWLWQHDKWKQQGLDHVKRAFRFAFVLIIFPKERAFWQPLVPLVKAIYPKAFLSFLLPKGSDPIPGAENYFYEKEEDLFLEDYRYQVVLDFYDAKKVRSHFKKLGAFQAVNLDDLRRISKATDTQNVIIKGLCKTNAL